MARPKLNQDTIIKRFIKTHGEKYDYSLVDYSHIHKPVKIKCHKHGIFNQMPQNHISGSGCKVCMKENMSLTQKQFINKSSKNHNNKYDYKYVKYTKNSNIVKIVCPHHGLFEQRAASHMNGNGCPKCAKNYKLDTATFIKRSLDIHGDIYNYNLVEYNHLYNPVKIKCHKHGIFNQMPSVHLASSGCPKCAKYGIKEAKWLDYMNVPSASNNRQVRIYFDDGNYIIADGFIPETNTIYEFWGDYWHGNINKYNPVDIHHYYKVTYQELYDKTLLKIKNIKNNGYTLIDIWESEWDKQFM